MKSVHYHPLVCNDDNGIELVPMCFSEDRKAVSEGHPLHLEEVVPRYYRLCAQKAHTEKEWGKYHIHCPICGKTMKKISKPVDQHRGALYCCTCRNK